MIGLAARRLALVREVLVVSSLDFVRRKRAQEGVFPWRGVFDQEEPGQCSFCLPAPLPYSISLPSHL